MCNKKRSIPTRHPTIGSTTFFELTHLAWRRVPLRGASEAAVGGSFRICSKCKWISIPENFMSSD